MPKGAKVFAPATVANIASGYDILGYAIEDIGDEIIGRLLDEPVVRIAAIHHDGGLLPREADRNTAGVAAMHVIEKSGIKNKGVELEIFKKMPFGSGMGSSAASAVAGAMAANEVLGRPFTKRELLESCVIGEQCADGAFHADNVAPSLLGGIILIRDNRTLDCHRIPTPKGLWSILVHPNIEILTKDSRAVLSDSVLLSQHIEQSGNLAAMVLALFKGDFDLLSRSLEDVIIEPQRARLIPGFYNIKRKAKDTGALGLSISGAGPSVFALSDNSLTAQRVANEIQEEWRKLGINSQQYISPINNEGARLL